MSIEKIKVSSRVLLSLGLAALATMSVRPADSSGIADVEMEGKVVCVPELMHQLYDVELPNDHKHLYGFQTKKGEIFTLLRTKFSEALFDDARVRAKDLLLKGRVFPNGRVFEVARIRSLHNGAVYDLHYFCSVCNIESVSPGPCACCQGPVDLVEKPLRTRHGG
jgi:hypothetical protein